MKRTTLMTFGAWMLASACIQAQANSALSFDGLTAYGEVGVSSAPIQNATYECWVKIDTYAPTEDRMPFILGRWGWWDTGMPAFNLATGEATGIVGMGHTSRTAPGAIVEGRWHHLATVTDGNASPGYELFLDGVLVLSEGSTQNVPGSTWTLCLGAMNYLGWKDFYLGEIDEARISTTRRYTSSFLPERRFQPDASTYGLWHFDEGTGAVAFDDSGNQHHFNLHGSFSWVDGNYPAGPILTYSNSIAGQNMAIHVQDATPGSMIYFCYSLSGAGPTTVRGGITLDLSAPIRGGDSNGWRHFVDSTGRVSMSVFLPPSMSGVTVWGQALEDDAGTFRVSNMESPTIQ